MGAWGHQPLENDAAWDIIGSITEQVIACITAALGAGDATRARQAIWLLGQLDARVPAVVLPESEILTEWRAGLLMLATSPESHTTSMAAVAAMPLATAIVSERLAGFITEGLNRQRDQDVLAALGLLALLSPDIDGIVLPSADTLDDWERRFWTINLSDWIDPDARAQAARETFAALRARRLPTTTDRKSVV